MIVDFCESNSDITCVLWHKNTLFIINREGQVLKSCFEFGLSNGEILFEKNLEINTAVIYKEFLLLGTNKGIQVVDINGTIEQGEIFENWSIISMVLENDTLILDRENISRCGFTSEISVFIIDLSRINLIV